MKMNAAAKEAFLRNLYGRGPFAGHAFLCRPASTPIYEMPGNDYCTSDRPLADYLPIFAEQYRREIQYRDQVEDDGLPICRAHTGTQVFAAAFGSPVHYFADSNPCALPFVKTMEEADAVPAVDLWNARPLMRVFELNELLRKEFGKDVWFGPCDCQSGFDTACLVWDKSEMFMAMYGTEEEQAAAQRLVSKCAALFKQFQVEFRREFVNVVPCHCPGTWTPPEMGPWLSNDECGAMNTETFEKFVLPELVDLAETFGGLGMHCCAQAEHQFESFKKIPNLYGFNRVQSGKGFEPTVQALGGPQGPVHTLAWIDEETIARLVQVAPAGTRFAFVLMGQDVETSKTWLGRMERYRCV